MSYSPEDQQEATDGGVDHAVALDATLDRERALSRPNDWPADFNAFVRSHSARLVRSLGLITLDRGLAEDAAQEAFLQLYLHWTEVPQMRDPAAWLYRVGINRCKNYRRALRCTTRLVDRLGRSIGETYEEWSPDASFAAVFRELPARQRTAATLHYLAGFSTAEISRTMDISEGAVSSHLYKTRQSLRKLLEASDD